MATERHPSRPTPRIAQPRLNPGSPPPPLEHPSTRILQKAGIKTGRMERNLSSRPIPVQSRPPSPALIVAGIVGSLFFVVLIVAVAGSGGSDRRYAASNKAEEQAPVEASDLEREGLAKCEQGRDLIRRCYDIGDRVGLQRGVNLIIEGNTMLERVNQMTGRKFDTLKYNQALKMARTKLMELK